MNLGNQFNNPDIADILKNWDKNNLTHKDVASEEKRLSKAFEEAVKNGADSKTLAGILTEWKDQHVQLNQMEGQLFDSRAAGEEPDVFQQYVHKSKENLAKGMNSLTNKTKEFIGQVKEGLLSGGEALTNKIKNAHENIKTVFHAKQAELSQKLGKFIDNVKDNIRDKQDFARVDRWAKAVDKVEEMKIRLEETKEDRIEKAAAKISGQTQSRLEENAKKFQKTVDNIDKTTFGARLKAGVKTISDAVQGKEYKEYSAHKPTQEAAQELKNAKDNLKKADAKAISIGNIKLGVVKAWTNLTTAFDQFKSKQYEKTADLSRADLENVKNPQARSYMEQLKEAQSKGMSMSEAMKHVDKMNAGQTAKAPSVDGMNKENKNPSMDLGR